MCVFAEDLFHVVCETTAGLIDFVCVCVLGYDSLSLGSLSRGPGEQMARRGKRRQFRNGNRGMREG